MKTSVLSLLAALSTVAAAAAADWPNWRGPAFDGSSPETGLPATFSTTEKVKWSVALPGPGGNTPIVVGDRVFLTAASEPEQKVTALCLDAKTGAVKWSKPLTEGYRADDRSNFAGPSACSDGKIVIFFTGTGALSAWDLDGKALWQREIQKDYGRFAFLWTFSTSPVLHDGRLIIQVLQRNEAFNAHGSQRGEPGGKNESYLLALDPRTGKELWKTIRPADAVSESLESFATPMPATLGGTPQLVVAGGDALTGHDPASGRELWRWSTWNPTKIGHWRLVPSPVVGGGVALACAPKGAPVYAVKGDLKGTHSGESDGLAWRSKLSDEDMPSPAWKNVSSDVPTPLFYQGHFWILNGDRQTLACVEPATGKVLWHEPLGGRTKIEASPTGADGKIYIMDHRADVYVVKADPAKFELLGKAEMAKPGSRDQRSCVVPGAKSLFVRTHDTLWCVGE